MDKVLHYYQVFYFHDSIDTIGTPKSRKLERGRGEGGIKQYICGERGGKEGKERKEGKWTGYSFPDLNNGRCL